MTTDGGSLADGSMTGLDVISSDPFMHTSATKYSQLTGDLDSAIEP